jgi:hypothetical protein
MFRHVKIVEHDETPRSQLVVRLRPGAMVPAAEGQRVKVGTLLSHPMRPEMRSLYCPVRSAQDTAETPHEREKLRVSHGWVRFVNRAGIQLGSLHNCEYTKAFACRQLLKSCESTGTSTVLTMRRPSLMLSPDGQIEHGTAKADLRRDGPPGRNRQRCGTDPGTDQAMGSPSGKETLGAEEETEGRMKLTIEKQGLDYPGSGCSRI